MSYSYAIFLKIPETLLGTDISFVLQEVTHCILMAFISVVPQNDTQTPLTKRHFFCHECIFVERNTLYRSCDPNLTQKVQENIITIALDTFSGYH